MAQGTDTYFALLPGKECAAEVLDRKDDYYSFILQSGMLQTWRRAYEYYYRGLMFNGSVGRGGDQGERLILNVNHYRNIVQHLLVMLVQQRPAFDVRATNADYKSLGQAILGKGLLEYYMREKALETYIRDAAELCLNFGEGFILMGWDATAGKAVEVDPQSGQAVHEGDVCYDSRHPMDVIRDITAVKPTFDQWVVSRSFENRYDLMGKYPDLAPQIEDVGSISDMDVTELLVQTNALNESDDVPVYTLYHAKTDALPQGRLLTFLDATDPIILSDGELPFADIPLYRITPGDLTQTIFGYTVGYDLLPIQQAINVLYSCVLTNQAAFGTQMIAMPKGNGLNVVNFDALSVIEFDPATGPPVPLNLTSTPAEIFNFMLQLQSQMELISGVNGVVRGDPESSLGKNVSGAAMALVQSTAINFSQVLSQSFVKLVEDVGMGTLNMLKQFATSPRVAAIVGKNKQYLMKTFTGAKLDKISRVSVDIGNPLTRTTAGRISIADTYMERGLIHNPDQYIQVVETGRLEPVIEGVQAELMNIQLENQSLSEGGQVKAILTDNHQQHVMEHKTVIATPDARTNPQILQNTLNHIQEHINLAMQMPPVLAMMTGQQPMMPQPMMGPGAPSAAPQANATPPAEQAGESVGLPQPPKIAGTNERADLAPGTAVQ